MNQAWLLPGLLLAVLASPLVFALVLLRVGRRGAEAARGTPRHGCRACTLL